MIRVEKSGYRPGFRASANEPAEPRRAASKRKDTKRWCAGKVGREHIKEWRGRPDMLGRPGIPPTWWDLLCTNCGKRFDYCWNVRTGCRCGHHEATA